MAQLCRETSTQSPLVTGGPFEFAVSGEEDGSERGSDMDPFSHPDLESLGRVLRDRLDETLDAEQSAARSAALRRRTLRDRLIESEDRGEDVVLGGSDGHIYRGFVAAVGIDHVVLRESGRDRFVSLSHIVSMEAL